LEEVVVVVADCWIMEARSLPVISHRIVKKHNNKKTYLQGLETHRSRALIPLLTSLSCPSVVLIVAIALFVVVMAVVVLLLLSTLLVDDELAVTCDI
jgi:hypothetical protein